MQPRRLIAALIMVAVCAVSTAGAAQVTVVATGGPAGNQTLAQFVQASPNLSTLATLLEEADLMGTLSGPGPYTLFTPTNAAFAALIDALPPGTYDRLLANKTVLTTILTYHVVPGRYTAAQLASVPSLPTVQGSPLSVAVGASKAVRIDEATVTQADFMVSNGVIHVIDAVLVPPVPPAGNNTTPTPTPTSTATVAPTITGNVTNTTTLPTATPTPVTTGIPFVLPAGVESSSEDYTGAGGAGPTATATGTATATVAAGGSATATVTATPTLNMTATTGVPVGNVTSTLIATSPAGTASTTAPVNTTATTRAGFDVLPLAALALAVLVLVTARRR